MPVSSMADILNRHCINLYSLSLTHDVEYQQNRGQTMFECAIAQEIQSGRYFPR